MAFDASVPPSPVADERELLLGFLHWQRAQVLATTAGLTDDQARWTPDGRLLPIIGVVNHLAHMERRWVDGRYLRLPFPPRTDEFQLGPEVTLASIVAAYEARAARTDEVVRAAPGLDALCLGREGDGAPVHLLLGFDQPIDLRYVVLHLIEETAHHAGHADSTRELLDGTRMRG